MPDWQDINEEVAQHLEDRYHELRTAGVPDEEARRLARAELDAADLARNVHQIAPPATDDEAPPGHASGGLLTDVASDVRFAFRTMRKNPAFTAVVLLTLALGIGANTAIFSVVNAVVLRPLPYRDADRLVVVWGNLHRPGLDEIPASAGEYVDYRDRTRALEHVGAYDTNGFNLTGGGDPERVEGAIVTPSLMPALGVRPQLGRSFLPEEEQPGRGQVVILSHALWTRRFHGDPAIVRQSVTVDGKPTQVVGVMAPDFAFPDPATEMWMPIVLDAEALSEDNRGSHGFTVIGRTKPGIALADAARDLNAVAATFKAEHPNNYKNGFSVTLRSLHDEIVGATGGPLFVLLGAVGLVLLIACANVANLLLARGASRRREMALRTALGASRGRLVRQLLTESVLFALAGGVAGLALASWAVDVLVAIGPDSLPRLREVGLDGRVVLFTTATSVATGLLFGLVPAIRASRAELNESLKAGGRSGEAAMHGRAGRLLVISEVALSLVLLIGAGLLIHSFARIQDVEPGFAPSNLLTFRLSLPEPRYTTFQKGDAFFDQLFSRLTSSPGIHSAAAINAMPFSGSGGSRSFYIEGREVKRPEDQPEEQIRFVTDGYFETMDIPVTSGRDISARDSLAAPRVALVNDAFARKHFPNGGAIGARVSFTRDDPRWHEIVGITGNIKHRSLDASDRAELYVPYRQPLFDDWTVRPMFVVVRTAIDPLAAVTTVRREISRIDPNQPISDVRTMDARIHRSLSGRRFNTVLLVVFAGFALTLAAIGIYGIVAYSVSQRTHEIGVRLALGAQRRDVRAMVVSQGMTMTAIGTAAGIAAALALTRVMSSLLFGIAAVDPITFTAIPIVLLLVALAACYLPARRATRVEPVTALRQE